MFLIDPETSRFKPIWDFILFVFLMIEIILVPYTYNIISL